LSGAHGLRTVTRRKYFLRATHFDLILKVACLHMTVSKGSQASDLPLSVETHCGRPLATAMLLQNEVGISLAI